MGMHSVSRLISIVDDDSLMREGLKSLLRSAGFATQAFASAEEFLSLAHRDNIACLILDVSLPGISGLELQSRLTATVSNHRTPVVFMTARDDEATRQRALKGGAVDFLRKPVRREALLNAVHLALQQNDGKTRG
jgi:two-component system, LuxR family, response regulator FixJ